jgi:hypothetical protein
MRGRASYSVLLVLSAVWPLAGQDGSSLSRFFETKQVSVQIDLPATQQGVDIYPQKTPTLDLNSYSKRLKQFGTALHTGDSVMITKVRVKNKVIEFQLGGGGYGTLLDDTGESVYIPPSDKSRREKDLENQIKTETNPDTKKKLRRELDDLRDSRERRDQRDRVVAAEASQAKKQRIETKRLQGGSRFNIRYDSPIPAEALTPEALMATLGEYLNFPETSFAIRPSAAGIDRTARAQERAPTESVASLRKGLTRAEMESLFGKAEHVSENNQNGMKLTTCTFQSKDSTIHADFVNDVLVKYTVSSR